MTTPATATASAHSSRRRSAPVFGRLNPPAAAVTSAPLPADPSQIREADLPASRRNKLIDAWNKLSAVREHFSAASMARFERDTRRNDSARFVSQAISNSAMHESEAQYPRLAQKLNDYAAALAAHHRDEIERVRAVVAALDDAQFREQLTSMVSLSVYHRAWAWGFVSTIVQLLAQADSGRRYLLGHLLPGLFANRVEQLRAEHSRSTPEAGETATFDEHDWLALFAAIRVPDRTLLSGVSLEGVNSSLELSRSVAAALASSIEPMARLFNQNAELWQDAIREAEANMPADWTLHAGPISAETNSNSTVLTTSESWLESNPEFHQQMAELQQLRIDSSQAAQARAALNTSGTPSQRFEQFELVAEHAERAVDFLNLLIVAYFIVKQLTPAELEPHASAYQRAHVWSERASGVLAPTKWAVERLQARAAAVRNAVPRLPLGGARAGAAATAEEVELAQQNLDRLTEQAASLERFGKLLGRVAAAVAFGDSIWKLYSDTQAHASELALASDYANTLSAAFAIAALFIPPPGDVVASAASLLCAGFASAVDWFSANLDQWVFTDGRGAVGSGQAQLQRARAEALICHATPFYSPPANADGTPGERSPFFSSVRLLPRSGAAGHFDIELATPYPYGIEDRSLVDPEAQEYDEAWAAMTRGKMLFVRLRALASGDSDTPRLITFSAHAAPAGDLHPMALLNANLFPAAPLGTGRTRAHLPATLFPEWRWHAMRTHNNNAQRLVTDLQSALGAGRLHRITVWAEALLLPTLGTAAQYSQALGSLQELESQGQSSGAKLLGRSPTLSLLPSASGGNYFLSNQAAGAHPRPAAASGPSIYGT